LTTFSKLDLHPKLLRALEELGYQEPTPIQAQAIPPLLRGDDVLGCAQTGTGKTAAFTLPILQKLVETPSETKRRRIRALVLTPTRELADQIAESVKDYGRFTDVRYTMVCGGVGSGKQIDALKRGIDVLVATPGRLLDLYDQGHIQLRDVDFFVLDEADRMLDMGFIHSVRKVLSFLPKKRQNLLFSATMPPSIQKLAATFLEQPVQIAVTPQATPVERIEQSVMFVDRNDKTALLTHFLKEEDVDRAIVFARTKHGANRLAQKLEKSKIGAAAIHGNKTQSARRRALESFKKNETGVLVATDIVARGIDIDDVSHVINFDLPNEPESYVHRIGRTARAGRGGTAISFCDATEGSYLLAIERLIDDMIPVIDDHPYHSPEAEGALHDPPPKRVQQQRPPRSEGRRQPGSRGRPGGGGGPKRGPRSKGKPQRS